MTTIIFTWLTTILCLIGTLLNVYKLRTCFILWSIGNIAWLAYDLYIGLYSRALLDIVQLAFAIWGFYVWSDKKI